MDTSSSLENVPLAEVLVPANRKGKATNLKFSNLLPDRRTAMECFQRAKKRLLNPPVWHDLAGWATARFMPFDSKGIALHRLIEAGDYVRIDIPGPGPKAGGGFDWVWAKQIEDRSDPEQDHECFGLEVRPCAGPSAGETKDDQTVAHFFKEDASSTFIVERVGNMVNAYYFGRNEIPNTETPSVLDNIRNSIVATGAAASLSEMQWSALSKGLLTAEIGG